MTKPTQILVVGGGAAGFSVRFPPPRPIRALA